MGNRGLTKAFLQRDASVTVQPNRGLRVTGWSLHRDHASRSPTWLQS